MTSASDPRPYPGFRATAALRVYDAYGAADRAGLEVGFEPLPEGVRGVLLRDPGVILVHEGLTEPERHDEITHQLHHWWLRPRPGQDAHQIEEAVRRETARRLIPIPALAQAVAAIIETDNEVTPDAGRVANLLGSSIETLSDRLDSINTGEAGTPALVLLGLLKIPPRPVRRHLCVQDSNPAPGWFDRLRGLLPGSS